ncbi:MAG TPA: type II secretion system protein GspM [Burkholderiales bacterium]|nr:type II secretion system protein GspM [Burkholderiales bacterium]
MKQAWEKIARRFDGLQPRERIMVFAAGVAVIAGLAFALSIDGSMTRQKTVAAALQAQRADIARLQVQNAQSTQLLKQDPDAQARKHLEDLRHELSGYDTELRSVQQGMVPPNRMARVLEEMLKSEARVRLVRLRTLPVAALVEPAKPDDAPAKGAAAQPARSLVYKHGIELTIEGSYPDLVDYQSRLENLQWRMFFARTRIDASNYPKVYMTVTLYTLSLEEAWLVV